jgi:putative tricarboxylic transport membrane protein
LWVRLLKIPYQYLFPLILLFCLIGAYTINNSATDVFVMLVFGLVGYLMRKFNYEGAPMVLALVLGPMIEQAFRQSLNMSGGSYDIFLQRPVSAVTLIIAVIITALSALPSRRKIGELNG